MRAGIVALDSVFLVTTCVKESRAGVTCSSQKASTIALFQSVICESGGPDGEHY